MKIGIEINNIIRDVNSQMLKYYVKDIDKKFDDSNVDTNVVNFIDKLGFKTKKSKEDFLYVDYPYEIFGCAKTMNRNTSASLNGWLTELENKGLRSDDVCLFSLKENALTIQSSYYFLSKIGCRIRNVFFPKDGATMWDRCDIIITNNERIIKSKPFNSNKKVVLISTNDTNHLKDMCDLVYSSFEEIVEDEDFFKETKCVGKNNLIGWIKNKFYNFFK